MSWWAFRDYVAGLLTCDSRLARRIHRLTTPEGADNAG